MCDQMYLNTMYLQCTYIRGFSNGNPNDLIKFYNRKHTENIQEYGFDSP